MLTKCPECQLQVSDKAVTCPHCGYPLKYNSVRTVSQVRKRQHKRLPNGFGQISQIKGRNLRKPFRAMVSIGKNPNTGRPIVRPLQPESYFETYNDAYAALLEYNRKPYDLENVRLTLKQVYEEWSVDYYKTLNQSTVMGYEASWKWMNMLYEVKIAEIRARHLRACIDECDKDSMKGAVKSLMNIIFDYAVENEYTDKNYARNLKYKMEKQKGVGHKAFTEAELEKLWTNCLSEKYVDIVLFQCYTGFRPQELGEIRLNNVNLKEWTIIGGMKTEAGRDRVVPVHEKIRGIVKSKYEIAQQLGSEYLFNIPRNGDMKMTYRRYHYAFESAMANLGIEGHKPHDPRKTFVTLGKKYNMDEYAIKLIVGHYIGDLTEKVYTERDTKWLSEELNKIIVTVPSSVEEVIGNAV